MGKRLSRLLSKSVTIQRSKQVTQLSSEGWGIRSCPTGWYCSYAGKGTGRGVRPGSFMQVASESQVFSLLLILSSSCKLSHLILVNVEVLFEAGRRCFCSAQAFSSEG